MTDVHPPRLYRLRYYLCCSLVVLVFVLIYFGSISDRLPWESSTEKKGQKIYTWPKMGKSDLRKHSSPFSKNKYQKQKEERLKMFSVKAQGLQKGESRGSKKERLELGMDYPEQRPSVFKRKDGGLRKDKGLWMEDRFPSRQAQPHESPDKQRNSEVAQKIPSLALNTQGLGLKNKAPLNLKDLWKNTEPPLEKTKETGVQKVSSVPLSDSSEIKRVYFPRRPSTGRKNSIGQIPRKPWRENQKPSPKNRTFVFKNKLSSSSDSLWKKTQNLWQDNKLVDKLNRGSSLRNKTRGPVNKLSPSLELPWKKTPPTQGQRREKTGPLGVPYGRKSNILGSQDPNTVQKPRKYKTPDDWPQFFEPRNQQQFSMEYHYRYRARRTCRTSVDMLVIVLSAPKNRLRRQAIRDTWGSVAKTRTWPGLSPQPLAKTLGVVFLLGEEKQLGSNVSEALKEESLRYGDVVQWKGLRNTAFNRTMKVLLGLKWAAVYCPQVSHVIKTDDDSFLHLPRLLQALLTKTPTSSLIWGFEVRQASATTRGGKNPVSPEAYPFAVFPPYVKGVLYVLPGNAVSRMVATAPYLPYNNMEDVHVTGTMAMALGLAHEPLTNEEMLIPKHVVDPCLFQRAKYGLVRVQIKNPSFLYRIWSKISDSRSCG